MKKLLLSAIALLAMSNSSSMAAVGETFVVDSITYVILDDARVGISKNGKKDPNITITSEVVATDGTSYTVGTIEENAFKWSKVQNIVLPNTIDSIKGSAFNGCDLVSIQMPENLRYIGTYAFGTDELESIVIPKGVTTISENTFFGAYKLESITFEGPITTIERAAFYKCTSLKSLTIPASCDTIAKNAFMSCWKLEQVTLPESLTSLGEGAFYECRMLPSIDIPEGVTCLGNETFYDCRALTTFNIGAQIDSLGNQVFASSGIQSFTVDAANPIYKAIDGVIYTADESILMVYPPKYGKDEYTVNRKTVGIGAGAFRGSDIKKVVIPEGLRAIDESAFAESQLSEINFPESLVFMGATSLYDTQLTSITLPENMPYVLDGFMGYCEKLEEITIPAGTEFIDLHAFFFCKALKKINILSTKPCELPEMYSEGDNPFGYLERDNVKVSVPKGYKEVFEESAWHDMFDDIEDDGIELFVPTAITPGNSDMIESISRFELTFPSTTKVLNSSPEVRVYKENVLTTKPLYFTSWMLIKDYSDPNGIVLFAADYDGYVEMQELDPGVDYFVIIPGGIIANTAGAVNERTVLHLIGQGVATTIEKNESSHRVVRQTGLNLTIDTPDQCSVSLVNMNGQTVASTTSSGSQAQLSAPQQGSYVVIINSNDGAKESFKITLQ